MSSQNCDAVSYFNLQSHHFIIPAFGYGIASTPSNLQCHQLLLPTQSQLPQTRSKPIDQTSFWAGFSGPSILQGMRKHPSRHDMAHLPGAHMVKNNSPYSTRLSEIVINMSQAGFIPDARGTASNHLSLKQCDSLGSGASSLISLTYGVHIRVSSYVCGFIYRTAL